MSNMRKLLLPALLLPALLKAQQVTVTGVAFDSLSGRPLPVAFVTLGSKSATADSLGRFSFDSVAPGTYRITMQHDLLDSLGLSGIAASVAVAPKMDPIRISTPSSRTMWRRVCPGEQPRDSGFVFGVVRVDSHTPAANALIVGQWVELLTVSGTVTQKGWRLDTKTSPDGAYVMCGVPIGTGMTLEAVKDSTWYAGIDVMLSARASVRRHDLTLADLRDSSARGTIRGSVTSEGRPVANVHVETGGLPEVVTGADGEFVLRGVRIGTRQVYIRGIGFPETSRIVEVAANDTARMDVTVGRVTVLDSVRVLGKTARARLADQFNDRRRLGIGYFRDSTQLAKYMAFEGVFATMPSVQTQRLPGKGLVVTIGVPHMRGRGVVSACEAVIIIDRVRSDANHLAGLRPEDLAAIEVYRGNEMPMDLATQFGFNPFARPCAVVAWTKNGWS
jgi:hypothetical protein